MNLHDFIYSSTYSSKVMLMKLWKAGNFSHNRHTFRNHNFLKKKEKVTQVQWCMNTVPSTWKTEVRGFWVQSILGNMVRPHFKRKIEAGWVAQVVECLPSKHEAPEFKLQNKEKEKEVTVKRNYIYSKLGYII
jgi:hypothetical protein